jgi:hypothetical protein
VLNVFCVVKPTPSVACSKVTDLKLEAPIAVDATGRAIRGATEPAVRSTQACRGAWGFMGQGHALSKGRAQQADVPCRVLRCRATQPTAPRPASSIAQVSGSGTAETEVKVNAKLPGPGKNDARPTV